MIDLDKLREFVTNAHAGQKRITGEDYVTHPIAVAEILKKKGWDERYQAVALAHDILEDVPSASLDLLNMFGEYSFLYRAVLDLTKTGKDMRTYISKIEHNPLAYEVKLADRYHNLTTAKGCSKRFIEKYIKETERYYLDLARGSDFEEDIRKALYNLKLYSFGEYAADRPYKEFEKIFTFEIAEPDLEKDLEEMEDRLCFSIVWNSLHKSDELVPSSENKNFIVADDVFKYLNSLKEKGAILHYNLVGYLGMCFDYEGNVID